MVFSLIAIMEFWASSFRAARALIGEDQATIASVAGVGPRVVMKLEGAGYREPTEAAHKVWLFYEDRGLEFLDAANGLGPGVRWRDRGIRDIFNRRHLQAGRVAADLRQSDFASKLNVTRNYITKFESGILKVPPREFLALAFTVLEREGIQFLNDTKDSGFGIRLNKPVPIARSQ
ncbi:helix-turn-helix domain-containing protein [Neorhizobium sp. DAR64872/K0K18]|uniref:helix-turn-helix domain-containing protein n=1 Tax=Neorhizobium sp. DAR64872/K0K18 TaxID=3421958 RepID=UPI003D2D95D9